MTLYLLDTTTHLPFFAILSFFLSFFFPLWHKKIEGSLKKSSVSHPMYEIYILLKMKHLLFIHIMYIWENEGGNT